MPKQPAVQKGRLGVRIPADPHIVAKARRHAVDVCRDLLDEKRQEDLALAVSELVTNAIRYGGDPVTLTVLPKDGVCRVEVTDPNPVLLDPPPRDDMAIGQRGLRLVEAVCRAWGWHEIAGGKCVWCEV